jgi:signal transduction histidine kinase
VTIRAGISDRFPLPPKDPKKIGPPSSDADFREGHRFSRWFHCAVTDKGIGIRPEDQGHLFEDFGQLDASSKKRFQGIGAGLTLARKFVELHGGRIWVNSEGEGKGATFAFAIPV